VNALRCLLGSSLAVAAFAACGQAFDTASPARQSATVVVANRNIIVLRGPIAGYSAQERVDRVTERIEAILGEAKSPAVTTEDVEDGTQVKLGAGSAFTVTRIDVDPQVGETTRNVAREAAVRLEQAVAEYREQRTPEYLMVKSARAALATAIYIGLLWLLNLVHRFAVHRIARVAGARAERVHVQGVSLLDPRQVRSIVRRLFTAFIWVLSLFATYSWLTYTLTQFPYTRPWGEHMEGNLFHLAGDLALGMLKAIPGLLVAVVILLIARLIIRIASIFFDRVERVRLVEGERAGA